ncbi:MAG: isoprenylcysteine carboxylmethyltransferase family protein [Parvibaculaceae bacterium]|nr:isoprenylcysteine carboxylmethyltransferase family protein [Parvibaculaceae bacterium]
MSQHRSTFAGTALFLVLAPGTVAGLIPWMLTGWEHRPPLLGLTLLPAAGWLLIALGLPILLESFLRFARHGGTPAPIYPTDRLVVTGFYRYVRNPMYAAVLALIAGQALVLGNVLLLSYGALIWFAFHLFVTLYEEPKLHRQFPEDYAAFFAGVPRWLPRLTPWSTR